jgi:hypothetical protein
LGDSNVGRLLIGNVEYRRERCSYVMFKLEEPFFAAVLRSTIPDSKEDLVERPEKGSKILQTGLNDNIQRRTCTGDCNGYGSISTYSMRPVSLLVLVYVV